MTRNSRRFPSYFPRRLQLQQQRLRFQTAIIRIEQPLLTSMSQQNIHTPDEPIHAVLTAYRNHTTTFRYSARRHKNIVNRHDNNKDEGDPRWLSFSASFQLLGLPARSVLSTESVEVSLSRFLLMTTRPQ